MFKPRIAFLLLTLALALPACSSESAPPGQGSSPNRAGIAPPTTQINPAELSREAVCTILPQEVLTSVIGQSIRDMYVMPTDISEVGCSYAFEGERSLTLRVGLTEPGQQIMNRRMQYLEFSQGTESVSLGDAARIQERQQDILLDAVLNGWYVTVEAYGGFTREQVLTLGQWLSARFVPYPQTATSTAASPTAPPSTGTMTDMRITIERPAQFAGVTTLQDLVDTGFLYYATCSGPNNLMFYINFMSTPGKLRTPVSFFTLSAERNAPVGTPLPVEITIGTGDAGDADKTSNWKGRATYTGDGTSGIFESDDGQVKGAWSCAFR